MKIKQPLERPLKHILVGPFSTQRGKVWGLVAARKVGNHYQVSNEALAQLLRGNALKGRPI